MTEAQLPSDITPLPLTTILNTAVNTVGYTTIIAYISQNINTIQQWDFDSGKLRLRKVSAVLHDVKKEKEVFLT